MKLSKLLYHIGDKEERIPTFIDSLDKLTGGLLVGGISTIAGRPAMGKTAFAMTVVRNVGVENKIPTAVLSLVEEADYVAKRLLATQFGWDGVKKLVNRPVKLTGEQRNKEAMQPPKFTGEQKEKIAMLQRIGFETRAIGDSEFVEQMKSAPVWIEHSPSVSMDEIVCCMERLKRENDVRLLVIDSFGWIAPENSLSAAENAMQKLVATAEKLKMAVLMTCELTRAVETRGGTKKPMLSDLRDNALAEKYSSLVMFLYRPEYYQIYEDDDGSTLGKAYVIVARNRHGDIGEVKMEFVNRTRFDSIPVAYSFYDSANNNPFSSSLNMNEVFF